MSLKTFVANSVNEIQELSQHLSVTWHHCPGSQNPADITTRGATVVGLHDTFISPESTAKDQDNVHFTGFDSNNEAIGNLRFSSLSFPSLFLCICFFF